MRAKTENKKRARARACAPLKRLFHSFFASLNIVFAVLLAVSSYSDMVSPEKYVLFAYLGLAFPLLVFVNLAFLAYWLFARKWPMVMVMVATFAVCWMPFVRYCPFHPRTKELPAEDVIKVLSYNVMNFAYKNHTKGSPNKIIQYIADSGADIVCLQEYMVSSRSDLMGSKDVARALPMYPYISEVIFSSPENARYRYGLAVLSKFPILSSRRIPFKSLYNGSSIHEVNVRGKKLVLVNNHLESFKLTAEDRSKYSDLIAHANIGSFEDLSGSIKQKLGQAFRVRAGQAETVAREIRKANGYYTLVCGDFNDTPISYTHRTMQGDLVDAYAESGFGPGVSYNQNFFLFRIDNIFHSSSMEAYNCIVDKRAKLSDHYPISCYLKMNP